MMDVPLIAWVVGACVLAVLVDIVLVTWFVARARRVRPYRGPGTGLRLPGQPKDGG